MDQETALTPAVLSPASLLPAAALIPSTPLPAILPQPPPNRLHMNDETSERPEAVRSNGAGTDYNAGAGQHETVADQSSSAVSWQRVESAEPVGGTASTVEWDTHVQQSGSTEQVLPVASLLSQTVTADFSVHKHHRSSSSSSNDERTDQALYDPPALSPQSSFAVQSVSDTSLPSSTEPSIPAFDTTLAHQPSEPRDALTTSSSALADVSDRTVEWDDSDDFATQVEREPTIQDDELEALSLSAITSSAARDEDEDDDEQHISSTLSSVDGAVSSVSITATASLIAPAVVPQHTSPVVVNESEEDEQLVEASMSRVPPSPFPSRPIVPFRDSAESMPPPRAALPPARPVSTSTRAFDHFHHQPPTTVGRHDAGTRDSHVMPARLTEHRAAIPPTSDAPPVRRQDVVQRRAVGTQSISPRPAQAGLPRRTMRTTVSSTVQQSANPFCSPSHIHSQQYPFQSFMQRQPRFVSPVAAPPAQRAPIVQPAPQPSVPAPIALSAPYVASKQALLETLARHRHQRADRQQQRTAPKRVIGPTPAAADTFLDTYGGGDSQSWQQQRHNDERLARMLTAWQLHGQDKQRSSAVARRQQEEKEHVEMEWVARQEEQRRQQERHWRRGKMHRPATPAVPLHAASAWQGEDDDSEAGGGGVVEETPASMVQLMESLRASARHEIRLQEAARQSSH